MTYTTRAQLEETEASSRKKIKALRAEFVRFLTVDSETKDRRRREYNQAVFDPETGNSVWSSTDMDMVLQKFDRAVKEIIK